ncbi:MAG TPA: VOC family protein [Thermomicrobiales bacterium]|nr:VOC family protein [Thermomicrobiales bacterium]
MTAADASTTATTTTTTVRVRPTGLHEFVLEVADLAAAARFYEDVIGLVKVTSWGADRPAEWFDLGDSAALGLWPAETGGEKAIAGGRGGAHVHFALRIPHGTFDAVKASIAAQGVPILDDVTFDDGNRSLYVNDPDGNCVELMDAVEAWNGDRIPEADR